MRGGRRHQVIDAGAEVGLVYAIDVQGHRDAGAGIAEAVDLAQARGGGDDVARPPADLAAGNGRGGDRVPAVVGFGQFTLQDLVGAPGLVTMHRAELPRAPDQVGDGEGAMRIGVGDVAGVGVGAAGAQVFGQGAQHIAGIGDAAGQLAQQGAGRVHLGGLHRFAQRAQVCGGKLDGGHGQAPG